MNLRDDLAYESKDAECCLRDKCERLHKESVLWILADVSQNENKRCLERLEGSERIISKRNKVI